MTEPTQEQIDRLIAIRERLTNRRDEQIDFVAVDLIDNMLREVTPGQRNDVDLLLGRSCAVLPSRSAYYEVLAQLQDAAHEAGVTAEWTPAPDTAAMIRLVWDALQNQPPIEY